MKRKAKKKLAATGAIDYNQYYKVPTDKYGAGSYDVFGPQGYVPSYDMLPKGFNVDLTPTRQAAASTMTLTPTPAQNMAATSGMTTASGRTKYKLIGGKLVAQ